jgi:outer membrane receptor protein involved in Fe transport
LRHPTKEIATAVSAVLRALPLCVPAALLNAPAAIAETVAPSTLSADIPAQPLAQALAEFSRQTDLNLVYVSEVVREKKSRAVSAGLRPEAALAHLLQGTGLKFEYLNAKSVRILAPEPAQTVPAEQGAGAATDIQIFVTGSRLPQPPNDISISPIISVTADDIKKTGLVRVDDILDNLPLITAEAPSSLSITSPGINTVSLRDLGSQRNLMLVNSHRMNPGGAGGIAGPGGNAKAVDINQIPAELIERIDVLTGGASAIYGADAVAGVINFVLNTHYQGVKIDAQYGFNNHQNNSSTYLNYLQTSPFPVPTPPSTVNTGQNRTASVLVGANFADDRGNATGYASFLYSSPAVGYQFDHAACQLTGGPHPNDPITCGGSGISAHGDFLLVGQVGGVTTTIVNNTVDPKTGAFRPFKGSDLYNYGALSYLQRQSERWTAGGFLTYDVSKHASVYSETMFARNTSQAQYGPSGSFFLVANTNCANPLLTAQEVSILCAPATLAANQAAYGLTGNNFDIYVGRRSVESGGRQDNYYSWSIRQVLGVKGEITDVWTYDTYAQLGISSLQDIEGNFLGNPEIDNALNVVEGKNGPECAVGPPCVPWNIWVPGGVTRAQLNYLLIPATYSSTSTEYLWDGAVTGDLGKYGLKLPTAKSGLNVAIGAEYRQEKFVFSPDYVFLNGFQGGGNPWRAINGQFHVWEGFTELRLPILDEKPGAYLLSLDAGYRYSRYTEGFNTNTYKVGVEWAPISDVRLRGGYNRAVRAPNIDELYLPAVIGPSGFADPCWGPAPVLPLAECERTGVTARQYGHIATTYGTYNQLAGGNTSLTPEIADTYTYGVVFQPQALPGFSATIDAFSIKITNTITSLSSDIIMNNCATTGDPSLCGLIHRGPSGSLWLTTANFVQATNLNIGTVSTKGFDVADRYRLNLAGMGTLNFSLVGTYVRNFLSTAGVGPLGIAAFDCAGYWGSTCGAPLPKWRHVLNTTWATPWAGFDATIRWRYLGSSAVDRSSSDPRLAAPFYPQTGHIPAYNYIDLAFAIPIGRMFDFRLGVNNIADKDPPLILTGNFSDCPNTTCNNNTWVGMYDTLGRYVYTHLSVTF